MNCENARNLLALRAGGDLPGSDVARLSGHLEACSGCRALGDELTASVAWVRDSTAPPVAVEEYAAIRRDVWRRIEAGGERPRSPLAGRLVLTAAGLFAAALAAVILDRRAPRESRTVVAAPPAATAAARAVGPSPALAEAPSVPAPAHVVTAGPVRAAASILRRPAGRRSPAVSGESAVERIEFRTANPNVRIIWLVRKGEEKSSSRAAGRLEEVS